MRLSSITTSLAALAVVVLLHTQPVMAAALFFSGYGSGSSCTQSAPCQLATAVAVAGSFVELTCADSSDNNLGGLITKSLTIDCAGTAGSINNIIVSGGAVVTLRNSTIWQVVYGVELQSGTLILDNVHITGANTAILAQPTSPSTITVRNCIFDTGGAAVLLKPSAGGSIIATFDHVTITNNSGGGIKIDTTNGPVTVEITDSVVTNNGGNGINAIGAGANQNVVSIKNSVIAKNGVAGVQANGASAGVLIQTTLLDQNASGATSIVNNGHISTYGNNSIVGTAGSGFTGSAPLQ